MLLPVKHCHAAFPCNIVYMVFTGTGIAIQRQTAVQTVSRRQTGAHRARASAQPCCHLPGSKHRDATTQKFWNRQYLGQATRGGARGAACSCRQEEKTSATAQKMLAGRDASTARANISASSRAGLSVISSQ